MAKESHIPGVLKFVDEKIAEQRRELAKQDDNKKKAVPPLDLSHIDKVIDDELARLRQRNSDDQANKAQALSENTQDEVNADGLEKTRERNVSDREIIEVANKLFNQWINETPLDYKGHIVKAFIKYGNEELGITPEHLHSWYPNYTKADLYKLGEVLISLADRKAREENNNFWRIMVEREG